MVCLNVIDCRRKRQISSVREALIWIYALTKALDLMFQRAPFNCTILLCFVLHFHQYDVGYDLSYPFDPQNNIQYIIYHYFYLLRILMNRTIVQDEKFKKELNRKNKGMHQCQLNQSFFQAHIFHHFCISHKFEWIQMRHKFKEIKYCQWKQALIFPTKAVPMNITLLFTALYGFVSQVEMINTTTLEYLQTIARL